MNSRFVGILLFVIILGCILAGFIVYPQLPVVFVSHWNWAGQSNGTMNKFWGVFIVPLMMLIIAGVWALLPHIDPIAPGFIGFRKVYNYFFLLIFAFLAYLYVLTLGVNLGLQIQLTTLLLPALAVLIFAIGALFPHLKRNWFIGIRTPWTISNDIVWNKTHKLGGWLFEIASLFILAAVFLPQTVAVWFILGSVLGATLISVVYSYIFFRAQRG
jgi:uncharacterized membrane protein